MKAIAAFGLILVCPLVALAADMVSFKAVTYASIGGSNTLKLTTRNRAIIKSGDHDYVVLQLLEAGKEEVGSILTFTCKIVWTRVTSSGVQRGTETLSVQKIKSEPIHGDDLVILTRIKGDDMIKIGDVDFRWWSEGSSTHVFIDINPGPGREYATIDVEQNAPGQSADRPESSRSDAHDDNP